MDIEGDNWDAAYRLAKSLLPPVPSPLEEDELGGEVVVGEGQGQLLVFGTEVAVWSVGLKLGSQGGEEGPPLQTCLWLILREDDELLVLQVAGQL